MLVFPLPSFLQPLGDVANQFTKLTVTEKNKEALRALERHDISTAKNILLEQLKLLQAM